MVGHPPTLSEGECEVLAVEVLRGEQSEGQQRKASITIRTDAHDSPRRGIGGKYPVRSKQVPDSPLSRSQKSWPNTASQLITETCMVTAWPAHPKASPVGPPFCWQTLFPNKDLPMALSCRKGKGGAVSRKKKEKRARTASPLRCSHRKPVALQVKIKAPTPALKKRVITRHRRHVIISPISC
jgi:hypothetical protein